MTKKDKTKLKRAAAELADVAEIHLAKLPEDEQAARVAAFSKEHFIDSSDMGAKSKTGPLR